MKKTKATKIKAGDVVVLKSGSPPLTVVSADEKELRVAYFIGGTIYYENKIPYCAVRAVPNSSSQ